MLKEKLSHKKFHWAIVRLSLYAFLEGDFYFTTVP